jgi:hypothetical protein
MGLAEWSVAMAAPWLWESLRPQQMGSESSPAAQVAPETWPVLLVLLVAGAFAAVLAGMLLNAARHGVVRSVLFIHRDGRLIRDYSSTGLAVDPVIFSGMLTALEAFVQDSVAAGSGPLAEMRFGSRSFVLDRGASVLAVAICEGAPPPGLRESLRACIGGIEAADAGRLRVWDGAVVTLPASVEQQVSGLLSPRALLPNIVAT